MNSPKPSCTTWSESLTGPAGKSSPKTCRISQAHTHGTDIRSVRPSQTVIAGQCRSNHFKDQWSISNFRPLRISCISSLSVAANKPHRNREKLANGSPTTDIRLGRWCPYSTSENIRSVGPRGVQTGRTLCDNLGADCTSAKPADAVICITPEWSGMANRPSKFFAVVFR